MQITEYKALGDKNERFAVGMLDSIKSNNPKLYRSLHEYTTSPKEGGVIRVLGKARDAIDAPYGRVLKDSISDRKFAVILYTDIKKSAGGQPGLQEMNYDVGMLLGEIENNVIIGTPESAAKALGLPDGLSFDIERYNDGYSIEEQIRDGISAQQKPLLTSNSAALPDARALLNNQIRFDHAVNDYLSKQRNLLPFVEANYNGVIDSIAKGDKPTPEGRESLKATQDRIERDKELVFKAIITPEKFELDADGLAVPIDVDALNNRFANTTQDSTVPLGDIRGEFNIGKVSEADKNDGLVVDSNEQILSAIRVVRSESDGYTNLYAIKSGNEYWLRAEYRQAGKLMMANEEAFANIGLNSNKFVVGDDTPASKVMAQITPAALRETITRQGLLAFAIQKKEMGYEHPVTEHKALDWVFKNDGNSHYDGDVLFELRKIDAQKADNRTTVVDLSAKQIEQLEGFGLIREAAHKLDKGYDYVGGASGHIIIDHKHDITQVIGQTLINTDRNDGPGFKKIEATGFDIVIRPDRPGVQYPYYGSTPAKIKPNVFLAAHNEDHDSKIDPLAGGSMRTQFQGQEVYAFDSRRYSGRNVVEAIAQSEVLLDDQDAKLSNNFGRGIKHPSVIKLEQMDQITYKNEAAPLESAQKISAKAVRNKV